jgi:large subunit ribosomal protein L3
MKFLLGKKIEMTQVFTTDGTVLPVTKVKVAPCLIIQKKTIEKDGYRALVCAAEPTRLAAKPQVGVFKKFGDTKYHTVREFRFDEGDAMYDALSEGMTIDASALAVGDTLITTSLAKGKGHQGIVKLHHFHGAPMSHGHKDQMRHSGSVGAKGPARIFKGTRMAGRMGGGPVTIRGLEVVAIDAAQQLLYIKGAIAGARHALIVMTAPGSFDVTPAVTAPVATPVAEAPVIVEAPVTAEVTTPVEAPVTTEAPVVTEEPKPEQTPNV